MTLRIGITPSGGWPASELAKTRHASRLIRSRRFVPGRRGLCPCHPPGDEPIEPPERTGVDVFKKICSGGSLRSTPATRRPAAAINFNSQLGSGCMEA